MITNGDPEGRLFYPILTLMMDSYITRDSHDTTHVYMDRQVIEKNNIVCQVDIHSYYIIKYFSQSIFLNCLTLCMHAGVTFHNFCLLLIFFFKK